MVVAHPDVVYKDADIQTTDFFNELQDLLKTIEDFDNLNMNAISGKYQLISKTGSITLWLTSCLTS